MSLAIRRRQRRKDRPMKKWSATEVKQILEYIIQENGHFERPTAQIYYTKLLSTVEIDASWDLIKWKVRNLKRLYLKANEWKNSTDASVFNDDDYATVKSRILNICPHFENLAQIFGPKDFNWDEYMDSTQNFEPDPLLTSYRNKDGNDSRLIKVVNEAITSNSVELPTQMNIDLISDHSMSSDNLEIYNVPSLSPSPSPSPTPISSTTRQDEHKLNLKKSARMSTLEQLNLLQNVRTAFYEKKLELETRKLELEKKKFEAEIQLKQELQKQNFEIEKLRLEKEERLAILEIELKYKAK